MVSKTSSLLLLPLSLIFLDFILISSLAKPFPATLVNVITYGAKPNGSTDSAKAFLAAWNLACASPNPTTIFVPKGRFLVGNLVFQGKKCKHTPITIRIAGSLIAPQDFRAKKWISFEDVTDVSLYGGLLDAQGTSTRAKSLLFTRSSNINIFGLTSIQRFRIVIDSSNLVNIDGVKIFADANSPNTDGIHVESSHSVHITNSRIGTGDDDCVSIGPGSTNVFVENVQCGLGHGIRSFRV